MPFRRPNASWWPKDFEYRIDGTDAERLAAIQKAQAWWTAEGQTKYSFDYIEKELVRAKLQPSPQKSCQKESVVQ
ncbi:MAG: hypothetical protein JWM11_5231 [Planctomycetaceae bacterium]|nr:hypothetical protein [Planctomycetaceae bacterium]